MAPDIVDELGRFAERRVCRKRTLRLISYISATFQVVLFEIQGRDLIFQLDPPWIFVGCFVVLTRNCFYAFIKLFKYVVFGHNGAPILPAVKERPERRTPQ